MQLMLQIYTVEQVGESGTNETEQPVFALFFNEMSL